MKKQESAAAAAEAARKRSLFDRIVPRAVRDVISELKKVTWPTREETTRLTLAVVVVAVTIGLALGAVDMGFDWLVENTLLR
jgi:preprotein translocase subunit SecE